LHDFHLTKALVECLNLTIRNKPFALNPVFFIKKKTSGMKKAFAILSIAGIMGFYSCSQPEAPPGTLQLEEEAEGFERPTPGERVGAPSMGDDIGRTGQDAVAPETPPPPATTPGTTAGPGAGTTTGTTAGYNTPESPHTTGTTVGIMAPSPEASDAPVEGGTTGNGTTTGGATTTAGAEGTTGTGTTNGGGTTAGSGN
jgi:hypothetical protein